MSAKVLVTGGAGYIGSHAVLALAEAGYRPLVLDNLSTGVRQAVPPEVPLFIGDVADRAVVDKILAKHQVSAVMHFAASIIAPQSVEQPLQYYENNTVGTLRLLECCIEHKVAYWVFSSTAAVYGHSMSPLVAEDAPTRPMSPYGASKLFCERMLADASVAYPRFRPVCLRYFNVAGADSRGRAGQSGQESTHLIRLAIETALGARPHLDIFGHDYETRDGTCERDYIHVSDLADAHVAALRYLEAGGDPTVLNCGYGIGYTVLEVVAALEGLIGRALPTCQAPRRPGDPPRLIAEAAEIRRRLDWRPTRADLAMIIQSALDWRVSQGGVPAMEPKSRTPLSG
jgi:UDP-glucose 4-epimerase